MAEYKKFDYFLLYTKNLFWILNKFLTNPRNLNLIYIISQKMKNIIESVLVKHLGKYIDGLKNSLDIGLLDGEVTI